MPLLSLISNILRTDVFLLLLPVLVTGCEGIFSGRVWVWMATPALGTVPSGQSLQPTTQSPVAQS